MNTFKQCDLTTTEPDFTPDLVYVDPPWGQGALTLFTNKAKTQPILWSAFLHRLIALVSNCNGYVFIEIGCRQLQEAYAEILNQGGIVLNVWETLYQKKPERLVCATWKKLPKCVFDFTGYDSTQLPYEVVKCCTAPNDLVFDPCVGSGTTMRAALEQGRRFIGWDIRKRSTIP